jgi:hypothetical protein
MYALLLLVVSSLQVLQQKFECTYQQSKCFTSPTHLILLEAITLTIYGEEYNTYRAYVMQFRMQSFKILKLNFTRNDMQFIALHFIPETGCNEH